MTEADETPGDMFAKRNDVVRIDACDELDEYLAASLRTFFRHLGVPHLFDERIAPALSSGDSRLFAAVRDRPWPPWGVGARKVCALCHVQSIGEGLHGLGPVYVTDEDATNIGLVGALLKEVLEEVGSEEKAEVSYLVVEGSVMASRVLAASGFRQTDDVVLTDKARYFFHRAEAQQLLEQLGLAKVSVPELLAHEIDDHTFERTALFYGTLNLAGHPHPWDEFLVREIIAIEAGLFNASLPGGVPPTPPSKLPGEIDPGGFPAVEGPG